jgi:hypothetical protein
MPVSCTSQHQDPHIAKINSKCNGQLQGHLTKPEKHLKKRLVFKASRMLSNMRAIQKVTFGELLKKQ